MRDRSLRIVTVLCVLSVVGAVVLVVSSPARLYHLTGRQRFFNLAVSRGVPRGAALSQLEAVVGPGVPVPGPAWLIEQVRGDPARFPDGWREGDRFVRYTFRGTASGTSRSGTAAWSTTTPTCWPASPRTACHADGTARRPGPVGT